MKLPGATKAIQSAIASAKPVFKEEDVAFIQENLTSILRGQLTMGKWVKEMERLVAEMAGTRYAVMTNSCTSALEIVLKGLGIGFGDEVLVPAQTFTATAFAAWNVGARPVFCDIRSSTHCMDPEDAATRITDRTRAMILVHYGGLITPDLADLEALCGAHRLHLIEDAAHAHGAKRQGRRAGGLGTAGCFSYYATKLLTTGGEGGALATDHEGLYEAARSYQYRGQDHALPSEEVFIRPGGNVRMTEFQALCGVAQHRHLAEFLERRNEIARTYDSVLHREAPDVELIGPPADTLHAYWKHTLNLPPDIDRAELKRRMKERFDVAVGWSYYPAVHLQPVFRYLYGTEDGMLPVSEDVTLRMLNLPMHAALSDGDVERVLDGFLTCFAELRGSRDDPESHRAWYVYPVEERASELRLPLR